MDWIKKDSNKPGIDDDNNNDTTDKPGIDDDNNNDTTDKPGVDDDNNNDTTDKPGVDDDNNNNTTDKPGIDDGNNNGITDKPIIDINQNGNKDNTLNGNVTMVKVPNTNANSSIYEPIIGIIIILSGTVVIGLNIKKSY